MANGFVKEEIVAFERLLEGFQDALILSDHISIYQTDSQDMERSLNTIWRPMPYISLSYSGTDMTSNFTDYTQLSVPATLGFQRSVPWILSATELRDQLQEGRLTDSARQKLASDINVQLLTTLATQGSLVVKRTTAATGFDDVAQCDAIMNEQGIMMEDRVITLNTRDYNAMASNLAGRANVLGKVQSAYEKAYIGNVASFDAFKMDYSYRLAAATGVGVTMNGANQYYTPLATTAASGGVVNNDNRFQTISITVSSGTVKVGDAFTLALTDAVHHITKQDTGQLKTFRITAIVTGAGGTGTVQITPPIISGGGGTAAELEYQNVSVTPANGAALTFLNTVTSQVNPFWQKDALELLPGHYVIPRDSGVAVMTGSTDQGVELMMTKFYDINTMKTKFRVDTFFGVVNKQTEMSGIMLFNQT